MAFADRFATYVEKIPFHDCWEWRGAHCDKGYGRVERNGVLVRAHRAAFELTYGPIPAGLMVLHRCDNPGCVRPDHLLLGTNAANQADKVAKGRQLRGEQLSTAKLTATSVVEIRARASRGESYSSLSREYGVSRRTVSLAARRVQWAHVA